MVTSLAFDPLRDFDGAWTTALAERYLPLPELAGARYECDDGSLQVTPAEASSNSYAESRLIELIAAEARAVGLLVYGSVNLAFNPGNWIQPDVTILNRSGQGQVWIPAQWCAMPVEMISPSPAALRRDRIDKPARCAAAGIPFFMRVEINHAVRHCAVTLLRLDPTTATYMTVAQAVAGQQFTAETPFPMRFDPADLLEP